MILTFVFIIKSNKKAKAKDDGYITVIVNNMDNQIVSMQRFKYNKEDSLFTIIDTNYNLTYDITTYGHYLTGISNAEFDITTNGMDHFLWFEIFYLKKDRSYSSKINIDDYTNQKVKTGIDGISLKNNMIFAINERDATHKATLIPSNNHSNDKIISTIIWCFFGISFIGIITAIILDLRKNKMTVRRLCILSFMTVLILVQEELLTFIPNVQFTFLLIGLYAAVFGFGYASLITITHITLDSLIMGALNPFIMLPMFIGYEILIALIYIARKRNLAIITALASISSIIYCLSFIPINAVVYKINVRDYFIADIPFEILLILSTILTYTYLYRPLQNILNKEWYKNISL